MTDASSQAILTVKPTMPARLGTALFVIVGFVLLMVCLFVSLIVTAFADSGTVGMGVAAALWALGMWTFFNKTRRNMEETRYEFHSDRLVFRMRDKVKTMNYDKIGHVLFKDAQTFIFSEGFDGLVPPKRMRMDVVQEEGPTKFREVIDLIRSNRPQHLFSYQNGRLEYSKSLSELPGAGQQPVSRIRTVSGRPAFNENDILLGDDNDPTFTVLRPYNKDKSFYYQALALIRKDPRTEHGRRQEGDVIVGFAGTDVSKVNLDWIHSDIVTGSGVLLGNFRIKRKVVSPIDDFELKVLGDTLKLRGDLFDKHYTLTLNDTPVGRMTSRFWSFSKLSEAVFSRPVKREIGLCLALAMNRSLLRDDDDSEATD